MQHKLKAKENVAATPAEAPAKTKTANAASSKSDSGITIGNKNHIKLTLGGYVEAAGIMRSRNETADMPSNFNTGIPFPNSPSNHMSEFRGSARQSRLSLLAEGNAGEETNLAAYFEMDFLGAAPTANSNESNSYNLRMRQIYATLDRPEEGTHILGGQAWSLLTMNKKGITPRQENIPLTIDAQYVPGFTWTRNPQIRLVQEFDDHKISAGISAESPQGLVFNGPNTPSGSPTFNNPGGGGFASTTNYSTDLAPDLIAKVAYDPGFGHYEVYGLARFFRDRNHFENSDIMGRGIGAGAIIPIIEKKLDFQISGLTGSGIGRYGSAQLPDVTVKPNGGLATVDSWDLLAGLVAHPDEQWDVYLYGGTERAMKQQFASGGKGYGYGSSLYDNSGCEIEGSASSTCVANTSAINQITGGFWWKFLKGDFGTMQVGMQDSYTTRDTFGGVGGSPNTDENITMVSLRYYPF